MSRSVRATAALVGALVVTILAASPVAGFQYLKQTGSVGHWSWDDSNTQPSVHCNYGPERPPDYSYVRSIEVLPPTVFAPDVNSGHVDSNKVSWQFQLQIGSPGNWHNATTSAVQKRTAFDNKAAPFTGLTVAHMGRNDPNDFVRVTVLIKWFKPNGAVLGTIEFRPSYYEEFTPFGDVIRAMPGLCLMNQSEG